MKEKRCEIREKGLLLAPPRSTLIRIKSSLTRLCSVIKCHCGEIKRHKKKQKIKCVWRFPDTISTDDPVIECAYLNYYCRVASRVHYVRCMQHVFKPKMPPRLLVYKSCAIAKQQKKEEEEKFNVNMNKIMGQFVTFGQTFMDSLFCNITN